MRWVQHAAIRPHRCAAVPFIGNSNTRKGFIDTGQDLPGWDPHVYVSVEAVEQMARMVGWQPAHVLTQSQALASNRAAEIERLKAELADANHKLEAVQVLKSAGYTSSRKPGRPPKERAPA